MVVGFGSANTGLALLSLGPTIPFPLRLEAVCTVPLCAVLAAHEIWLRFLGLPT